MVWPANPVGRQFPPTLSLPAFPRPRAAEFVADHGQGVCRAQYFAPPVPACPAHPDALLEALTSWALAEAEAVVARAPAAAGDIAAAKAAANAADYAAKLRAWSQGVGGPGRWPIPCVRAAVYAAARAVADDTYDRLHRAVALYRREHRALSKGDAGAADAPTHPARRKHARSRPAQVAAQAVEKALAVRRRRAALSTPRPLPRRDGR